MKTLIAALVLLSGCASVNFAERRDTDVHCNPVQIPGQPVGTNVTVAIRSGAWLECPEARAAVQSGLAENDVIRPWAVLFVDGFAGFGVDSNLQARTRSGQTYPESRTVAVVAGRPYLVTHELGHASDVDHGRPNRRDRDL